MMRIIRAIVKSLMPLSMGFIGVFIAIVKLFGITKSVLTVASVTGENGISV